VTLLRDILDGKSVKGRILPLKISDWPVYWRELYEERAAIIEFMANRPHKEAEWLAERAIRRQFQQAQ
jgi:hypothetical protein